MSDKEIAPGILRMEAGEIDLLDQENALLELEDIVDRVRTMAAVSYDLDIEEVWEFLTSGLRAAMPSDEAIGGTESHRGACWTCN